MSTDRADYPGPLSFEPLPRCCGCQQPLPPQATFCPACGVRQPPKPDSAPRLPMAIARQPIIQDGEKIESRLQRAQSLANSLILFPQSGALNPRALPEEPPTWITPDQLPEWLEPARTFSTRPTDLLTPDWLNSSGKTHPPFPEQPAPEDLPSGPDWRDTLKGRALPHLPEPGAPAKVESYPPLPDGTVSCTKCWGCGNLYEQGTMKPCPACKEKGRIPPAIPQPVPALQPEEAAITGPTAPALEALEVASPAKLPQTTDPMPGIVEETEGPRRHLEDLLEDVAECMTGAGIQLERWADRLAASRDRLEDTAQRLDWMGSAEVMVLGMTKDAADKAVVLLRKAASAARDAEKHLMSAEMALDVGLLHATAWEDTFGSGRSQP